MHLKKIKLVGFKSFVDPTVLEFRSPLVGVVGPNGCGKSNIIDAVRWVMGESSAKQLRGESMEDVIFNGSAGRKPVGQASVELLFNNENGLIGGEYAQFQEISIRRQATRDGVSAYFLNGTRCRRKDITDMFLGTGLGSKSYAIIEQGMISKVIEAKPEVLRGFVEGPAGIAVYRQRRHETELRMRHTRENLERLSDLRQEQEKQLDKLQRQADAQGRYQEYKDLEQKLEVSLAAFRFKTLDEALQAESLKVRTKSTDLEAKLAKRGHLDLEYEKERLLCVEKRDAWQGVQTQFYELGTEIARLEQTLQHYRDKESALKKDLDDLAQELQKITEQEQHDLNKQEGLLQSLATLEPDYKAAKENHTAASEVHQKTETAVSHWNTNYEDFLRKAEEPNRLAEVEKARIEQLERQTREGESRLKRSEEEYKRLDARSLEDTVEQLEKRVLDAEELVADTKDENTRISHALTDIRTLLEEETKAQNEIRGRLQSLKGRESSLEALQQAALGKTDTHVNDWLSDWQWNDCVRLGEALSVEQGYERALETVLDKVLEAICLPEGTESTKGTEGTVSESTSLWVKAQENLTAGTVTLFESTARITSAGSKTGSKNPAISASMLLDKINTKLSVASLLQGIYVVDTLDEALTFKQVLSDNESVVTKEGIWLGSNWVRLNKGQDPHDGILQRAEELKTLRETITALEESIQAFDTKKEQLKLEQKTLENQKEALSEKLHDETKDLNAKTAQLSADRVKLNNLKNRKHDLEIIMNEDKQKVNLSVKETSMARLRLGQALESMADFTKRREALQKEKTELHALYQAASQKARSARDALHTLELQREGITRETDALNRSLARVVEQKTSLSKRQLQLSQALADLEHPKKESESSLEQYLQKRLNIEGLLTDARTALESVETALQQKEKERGNLEREANDLRNDLDQLRLEFQSKEIRQQTVKEKIAELGVVLADVLQTLPDDLSEPKLVKDLEQVQERIARLGPINLAAIEEFKTEQERKLYLDSQHKDLVEALETLENAIRKIDKETKTRFKETFDRLNEKFQTLFPKLFGGGEARLELLGEDLLEAGVSVTARPPGKRNSSIHLLSGGEKALTAVSLVFAIFQLNPAPFCLLDEVDAPLDDANVGRFCDLVKEMASTVQFVVVTHNKIAMEIVDHLVGVTMKEPGVSRLVSVDVEEARMMAEAEE